MMQRKPLRQLDHFLNDAIRYAVKRDETLTKSVSAEEMLTEEKNITLVACRNKTKGKLDLMAASYSTPMIIPLSMRTAV